MRRIPIPQLVATLLLVISCSVKEDRQPCPCWLDIDLQQCGETDRFKADDVTVSAWNDRFIFEQTVDEKDYRTPYEKAVPKSYVSTSVVAGEEDMIRDGCRLIIPVGADADRIWAYAGHVACFGETAHDRAVLHKQFARVKVRITNPVGDRYPYSFRLRTQYYGLDLRDLRPVEGMTDIGLERGSDDIMEFNLIRQPQTGKIRIDIYEGDERLETFPVDEWIRELGYDWNAVDLEDIDINIDYAKGEISVKVNDWGDGGSIRIEI